MIHLALKRGWIYFVNLYHSLFNPVKSTPEFIDLCASWLRLYFSFQNGGLKIYVPLNIAGVNAKGSYVLLNKDADRILSHPAHTVQ